MAAVPWLLVVSEDDEQDPAAAASASAPPPPPTPQLRAAASWQRITRRLRRIRCLQRRWGILGGYLQSYPASLWDRLQQEFI